MRIDNPDYRSHLGQIAGNSKYCNKVMCVLELTPGIFCLYSVDRQPLVISDDWNTLREVYLSQPEYVPKSRHYEVKTSQKIDLASLKISI